MKNNRMLIEEILGVFQSTNAQLGFIVEAITEGASQPSSKELYYALHDIWVRNHEVIAALEELHSCL